MNISDLARIFWLSATTHLAAIGIMKCKNPSEIPIVFIIIDSNDCQSEHVVCVCNWDGFFYSKRDDCQPFRNRRNSSIIHYIFYVPDEIIFVI